MSRTQHTDGPWDYHVSENSPDHYSITANGGDPQIAEVERWNGDGDECEAALEAESNACLIAAAPELLKALKLCRNALSGKPRSKTMRIAIEEADAAIARVLGTA